MASTSVSNDDDERDLLICGICLDYYDDGIRTPKMLECFHSCCLTCLRVQAVTAIVACPYCRKETNIRNGVENMTTNFYIMPRVQKEASKRKNIEDKLAKAKDNWAESIARRRDVQAKLNMVLDSLKIIENTIMKKSEDNNEKIAILQSLLEDPFYKKDIEDLLASSTKCESDHKQSKEELTEADSLQSSFADIEDFIYCLTLKNENSGANFNIKLLENKAVTFSNKSSHGPHMGSYQSMLSFILFQLKEDNQWNERNDIVEETDQSQACATNESRSFAELKGQNGFVSSVIRGITFGMSSDECSTADSESSSGEEHNMCYMQFKVNNTILPKVIIRLNFDQAPKMSKRFMGYCTGFSGFSYKLCSIFMNKHGESFTAGKYEDLDIVVDQDGVAGSLPNGWCDGRTQRFIADHSTLNESKGALRMRHRGRTAEGVYVCSEFSIICRDHPNNSQMTTVFGYVVRGIEICESISRHDLHDNNNNVSIHSCGVWYE